MFMAFAPTLAWLYLGRILNGMTAASFSTANAYVADITAPEKRARNFGIMGSAFGFGFVIGPSRGRPARRGQPAPAVHGRRRPLLGQRAVRPADPARVPGPRSPRRLDRTGRRANPLGAFAFLRERRELLGLASVGFLFQLAYTVLPSIFVLYTGYRYHWTPAILGLTFMATGASMIAVQMFLVGPVVKRIGERGAVLWGATFGALGFLDLRLRLVAMDLCDGHPGVRRRRPAAAGPPGPDEPSRRSRSHQGQLQGANQSLQGIAAILGPALVRPDLRLVRSGMTTSLHSARVWRS